MKSTHILTALLVAATGACAHAEGQGLYLGGSVGGSDWSHGVNGIDGNSHGLTGKVYGGYELSPRFAIEAGVARLGSVSDSSGRAGANAAYVDGVGTLPLADKWSLIGRAGLARAQFNGSTGKDSGTGLKLGAGVQYALTQATSLRAEYEHYHVNGVYDSHANIGQFSVGVKTSF
jgi:OmpA-OmpF porin, OOP family